MLEGIKINECTEHPIEDAYRPRYHFAIEENGYPGDPNGAFFADGVYHLMFLYHNERTGGYHWGHLRSEDLLHWERRPDALCVQDGDEGCYSGGGFLDEDKTAYISFWKFPGVDKEKDRGGIGIARASAPYDCWERISPLAVASSPVWGVAERDGDAEPHYLACADPSNIWRMNGKYYMQAGNLLLLAEHGKGEASPLIYRGDYTDLFRSDDLRSWEYVGRFYENNQKGVEDWPTELEDDMCPSFLPLFDAEENGKPTGKHLQLFISHKRGCQYYIGTLEGERFLPEMHGRMSWRDSAYFAPEALLDDKNRHIIWTWLRDNPKDDFERFGWSGVLALPRVVWYADGELKIAPARELDNLQCDHIPYRETDGNAPKVADGELCRIRGVWKPGRKAGVAVRVSDDGSEYTEIYYSPEEKLLVMDTTHSGSDGWCVREEAPLMLEEGEELSLDIFVDKSVIEVFANRRQAICRRVYPTSPQHSKGVRLIGEKPVRLDTYRMSPTDTH